MLWNRWVLTAVYHPCLWIMFSRRRLLGYNTLRRQRPVTRRLGPAMARRPNLKLQLWLMASLSKHARRQAASPILSISPGASSSPLSSGLASLSKLRRLRRRLRQRHQRDASGNQHLSDTSWPAAWVHIGTTSAMISSRLWKIYRFGFFIVWRPTTAYVGLRVAA